MYESGNAVKFGSFTNRKDAQSQDGVNKSLQNGILLTHPFVHIFLSQPSGYICARCNIPTAKKNKPNPNFKTIATIRTSFGIFFSCFNYW